MSSKVLWSSTAGQILGSATVSAAEEAIRPGDPLAVSHVSSGAGKALPGLILCLSPEGVCRAVTPPQRLERWGLPDEILGRHLLEVLPPASRETACSCLKAARETGKTQVLQYLVGPRGGEKCLEAHLAVGDQSDLVLVVHDITETRSLKNAVLKLLAALYSSREQTVKSLLPVCAWCNRVSNDRNEWKEIGELIEEMSLASTTHGICPDCTNRQSAHFPAN